MPHPPSLNSVIETLRKVYGKTPRPVSRDPFELILWEQVAYLVPDDRRQRAFEALRTKVGLTPAAILEAPAAKLLAVAKLGGSIGAAERAERLRRSAELVFSKWTGDLRKALALSAAQARRALSQFPMIGEPGAEKILVFTRTARFLPLDSNGLRVLVRLGLTVEGKDYGATYRVAQETLAPSLPDEYDELIAAYYLLRRHGQELCRRSEPECERCPLREECATGSGSLRTDSRA